MVNEMKSFFCLLDKDIEKDCGQGIEGCKRNLWMDLSEQILKSLLLHRIKRY